MTTKKKATTIREIAKLANVSYQTVSLVINDKSGVSDETRKRIQRLMRDMDYHPNKAAQMLMTNRSYTLELIIVDVSYGGRLADSTKNMARSAKEAGYSLLVYETEQKDLPAALDNAAARMVDGVVMYAPRLRIPDEELKELCNGIPLVRRDYMPSSKLAWVGFDQVYASRLGVEHLIELGHRQIATIPPLPSLVNGYWRALTWDRVFKEHDIERGPTYAGDYSMRSGYEAAQEILKTGEPFTALLVGTDYMALGAMRALREHGLRVPDDVSVIGYDNAELSAYIDPPLTTIEFKFAKQDEMSVKYLLEMINDPEMEPHQRVLMPDLIVRQSTRRLE